MAALDEWSNLTSDDELENRRNDEAHGGNVVEDIRIIRFMKDVNMRRMVAWASAFHEVYGVSYNEFHNTDIDAIPSPLRKILNIRACIHVMKRWKNLTEEKENQKKEVSCRCEEFIEEWKCKAEDFLQEGSKSMNLFKEVIALYYY